MLVTIYKKIYDNINNYSSLTKNNHIKILKKEIKIKKYFFLYI